MNNKPTVCIFGKLPPPYMGPAIATQILLQSGLKNNFNLVHIDTKINEDLKSMGSWSLKKLIKNIEIYIKIVSTGINAKPNVVLIPISQSTVGFIKDSLYILLSRVFCKKLVLHLRGSEFKIWMDRSSFLTRFYVKLIFRFCTGVIVLGNNLRYLFEGFFPEDKIFVAPNGADYIIPKRTLTDSTITQLLYLGNLQSSKGIEDVIESIRLLPIEIKNKVEVNVLGGWRDEQTKQRCLEKINKNQLPIIIHSPDKSEQKLQMMSNADIFIFPPRAPEGHPWVIVEAMAAGLPIISTDRGAIIESVKHEENGFIVPLSDPQAIANYIQELINFPEKRQRMGQNSRKHYLTNFTEVAMVENLTHIFHKVIEK
ncbi:MAG: glycosyltransferase family 4 protein [Bacteroidetes bacterium]|nr:glycosyltransferase family 4 protein [Bacteroidota bacterium]